MCEGEQVYIKWLNVCTEDRTDDYWVWCFVRETMQHLQSYTCFNMPKFTQLLCPISFLYFVAFIIKKTILVYNRQINTTTKLWTTEQVTKHRCVFTSTLQWGEKLRKTKENCSNLTPEQEPHTLRKLKLSQPFFGLSTQTLSSKVFFLFFLYLTFTD